MRRVFSENSNDSSFRQIPRQEVWSRDQKRATERGATLCEPFEIETVARRRGETASVCLRKAASRDPAPPGCDNRPFTIPHEYTSPLAVEKSPFGIARGRHYRP
jgi:hypothetical protein